MMSSKLLDLDDQKVLCRRQSAVVIEQVFDAIDITEQQRDRRARGSDVSITPNFSSTIFQYYNSQGSLSNRHSTSLTHFLGRALLVPVSK